MAPSSTASAPPSIAERFADARARIDAAARAAERADPVVLTAVSKTQPPDLIDAALATGQRVFGENRVQEAIGRWKDRNRSKLELRLIGPLQTNKAADALRLFDIVETLDRERLAETLAGAAERLGRPARVLVQVNTGEEPQKAGVAPNDADALISRARELGLSVEGLMAIPPVAQSPRPHFALLADIARRNGLSVLSMGMSDDFEAAIAEGATHVRLGSALFGPRAAA